MEKAKNDNLEDYLANMKPLKKFDPIKGVFGEIEGKQFEHVFDFKDLELYPGKIFYYTTPKEKKIEEVANKFTGEQATKICKLVSKLTKMGAFLGGSREKLNNFNFYSPTDWDFNVQYAPQGQWGKVYASEDQKELYNYVLNNFTPSNHFDEEASDYAKDDQFVSLWKHKEYEHITVIFRYDLSLYKRAWNCIDTDLWKNYIWKSNPNLLKKGETAEEKKKRKVLTKLILNSLYEACREPSIDEFL